jgi:hypothetical protein
MRMDTIKPVAMFVIRQPDCVRAVPEGAIQHRDILLDQRLLIAFE